MNHYYHSQFNTGFEFNFCNYCLIHSGSTTILWLSFRYNSRSQITWRNSKVVTWLMNENWEELTIPTTSNWQCINCKWIYMIKHNGVFGARLLACRFSKTPGFDFTKICSPLVHDVTFPLLLDINCLWFHGTSNRGHRNNNFYTEI